MADNIILKTLDDVKTLVGDGYNDFMASDVGKKVSETIKSGVNVVYDTEKGEFSIDDKVRALMSGENKEAEKKTSEGQTEGHTDGKDGETKGGIGGFFKNNWKGILGMLGGMLLLGPMLEMGVIGALLVGLVGFALGGFLGGEKNGLLGGLMGGGDKKDNPQGAGASPEAGVTTPGQTTEVGASTGTPAPTNAPATVAAPAEGPAAATEVPQSELSKKIAQIKTNYADYLKGGNGYRAHPQINQLIEGLDATAKDFADGKASAEDVQKRLDKAIDKAKRLQTNSEEASPEAQKAAFARAKQLEDSLKELTPTVQGMLPPKGVAVPDAGAPIVAEAPATPAAEAPAAAAPAAPQKVLISLLAPNGKPASDKTIFLKADGTEGNIDNAAVAIHGSYSPLTNQFTPKLALAREANGKWLRDDKDRFKWEKLGSDVGAVPVGKNHEIDVKSESAQLTLRKVFKMAAEERDGRTALADAQRKADLYHRPEFTVDKDSIRKDETTGRISLTGTYEIIQKDGDIRKGAFEGELQPGKMGALTSVNQNWNVQALGNLVITAANEVDPKTGEVTKNDVVTRDNPIALGDTYIMRDSFRAFPSDVTGFRSEGPAKGEKFPSYVKGVEKFNVTQPPSSLAKEDGTPAHGLDETVRKAAEAANRIMGGI